jgi:recombination protein RecA
MSIPRERLRDRADTGGGGNYFSSPKSQLDFIPTGCKLLDLALGGGWAEGRIGNIVGDKSTGKTLLCIEAAANFTAKYRRLDKDAMVHYREAEAAFDDSYAEALGMPMDRVDFGSGTIETIEDLFEDIELVVKKAKGPILYIIDSLDALSDRAEMGRDMDAQTYGVEKAKKLSQLFRRLTRQMSTARLTFLVVSQVRSKIGNTFGGKTTTRSGGRALDFYASQVLFLSQIGTISRTISKVKRPIGITVKAKCDKNKISLPFREAEFQLMFGYGIDDVQASLMWLREIGENKFVNEIISVKKAVATDADIKSFSRDLIDDDPAEARAVAKEVNAYVQKRWFEIERSFLPSRKKYS